MKKRFDVVELISIAIFVALVASSLPARVVTVVPAPPAMIEQDVLAAAASRYGPEKFSQGPEEWLIRDFFQDKRGGVFVDVGAYDAKKWSNTYRLEHDLGWGGVAIDAIREFAAGYTRYRPRSRFFTAFVADRDTGTEILHLNPEELASSSGDDSFTHIFTNETVARQVPIRTLDGILAEAKMGPIDLLSMDIELGEPVALAHFTIARYHPELAVVEAQGRTRQAILDYFARAGYVVVGRYLHADTQNLYFAPLGAVAEAAGGTGSQ